MIRIPTQEKYSSEKSSKLYNFVILNERNPFNLEEISLMFGEVAKFRPCQYKILWYLKTELIKRNQFPRWNINHNIPWSADNYFLPDKVIAKSNKGEHFWTSPHCVPLTLADFTRTEVVNICDFGILWPSSEIEAWLCPYCNFSWFLSNFGKIGFLHRESTDFATKQWRLFEFPLKFSCRVSAAQWGWWYLIW